MIKVLFVCLGNICRSPMAEAVFKKMVEDAQLGQAIVVDSAATSNWEHGNPVHAGTQKRLAKEKISCHGMFSRPLEDKDLKNDYIVGMDTSNIKNIQRFIGKRPSGQVKKLLEYANIDRDIADPYYTGDFDQTYQDVMIGSQALLDHIIAEHNLS